MFDGTGTLFLTYGSKHGAELLAFGFEAVPVAAAFFGSRKLAQTEVVAVRTVHTVHASGGVTCFVRTVRPVLS